MAQQTIAEALAVWREGERLLEQLPPVSPDRGSVALAVSSARDVYTVLSRDAKVTADLVQRSQMIIADARTVISEARARSGKPSAPPAPVQSAER